MHAGQLGPSISWPASTEFWKAVNVKGYPVKLEKNNENLEHIERIVRTSSNWAWNEDVKTTAARESFSRNGAKLLNAAPEKIKFEVLK